MKKQKIVKSFLFLFMLFGQNTYSEIITIDEIRIKILNDSFAKIKNDHDSQIKSAGIKNGMNRYIPEVSLFGGMKSKKNEVDFSSDHFVGLRTQYRFLDGGERALLLNKNERESLFINQIDELVKLGQELKVLEVFAKESSLKEKHELISNQLISFQKIKKNAESKKLAGVLSILDYKKIESTERQLKQLLEITNSEIELVNIEKMKVFNLQSSEKNYSLKESLDQINEYLERTKLNNKFTEITLKKKDFELETTRLDNLNVTSTMIPEGKVFVEKSLSRKIEGQFLDGDDTGNLTFGIEFEIPLIKENNSNFTSAYKARLSEKILELEKQEMQKRYQIESKLFLAKLNSNKVKIENFKRNIEDQTELLKIKENSIKNGLVSFLEYSDSSYELFQLKYELIELKEIRNSLLTSLSAD